MESDIIDQPVKSLVFDNEHSLSSVKFRDKPITVPDSVVTCDAIKAFSTVDTSDVQLENYCTESTDQEDAIFEWYTDSKKRKHEDISGNRPDLGSSSFSHSSQIILKIDSEEDTNKLEHNTESISTSIKPKYNETTLRYDCPFENCSQVFKSKYVAQLHINSIHLNLLLYPCNSCEKKFSTPRRRYRHYEVVHRKFDKPQRCSYKDCERMLENSVSAIEHMFSCHRQNKEYNCSICVEPCQSFRDIRKLQKHVICAHSRQMDNGKFVCPIDDCSECFMSYRYFRLHLTKHNDTSKQHACEYCNETFVNYNELLAHRKKAHSVNCIVCSLCNKKFKWKTRYSKHVFTEHSSDAKPKSFLCPVEICKKSVSSVQNLKEHINYTHLSLRHYKCNLCNTTLMSINSAIRHNKNLHTNEKRCFEPLYLIDGINSEKKVNYLIDLLIKRHPELVSLVEPYGKLNTNHHHILSHLLQLSTQQNHENQS